MPNILRNSGELATEGRLTHQERERLREMEGSRRERLREMGRCEESETRGMGRCEERGRKREIDQSLRRRAWRWSPMPRKLKQKDKPIPQGMWLRN